MPTGIQDPSIWQDRVKRVSIITITKSVVIPGQLSGIRQFAVGLDT